MKYTSQSIEFIKYTDGRGVNSVVEYYYATATENATLPEHGSDAWKGKIEDTGFSAVNKYLWNYEKIEFTFGDPSTTEPGLISIWGKEIEEIYEFYMLNNSEAVPDDAPYLNQNGIIQYPNKEWKQYTSNQNIPVPTEDNRFLWNREITLYTDKTAYNSNVACVAVHGGALYSMSLDNDSDVIAVSSSNGVVDYPIVNITTYKGDKIVFDGTINVTTTNCDVRELDENKRSYEIIPNGNENAGSATFEWKISGDNEKVLTKTFNFKKITSIVDYDLVVSQTTINKSKGDASISVSIHKKETGKPIQTLTPSLNGEVLVKYQLYGSNTEATLSGGTLEIKAIWMGGPCSVRLVSSDGSFTWDEETIEIVNDGSPGSNGATITNTETQYCQITSSSSVPPGTSWSTTQPAYKENHYIWTRLYFTLSDNTHIAGEPTRDDTLNTIAEVESDVSNLEDDVGTLEGDLNDLNNDYSGFKDQTNKQINNINNELETLPDKVQKAIDDLNLDPDNIMYKGDITQSTKTDSNGIKYVETVVPSSDGSITYSTYDADDYIVFGRSKGNNSDGNNYVCIDKEGLLTARNALIYGTIYATAGEFFGTIKATGGYIGDENSGWKIGNSSIYNGKSTYGSSSSGIYLGTNGISVGDGSSFFKAPSSGSILIHNAVVTGGFTAENLSAGGWSLINNKFTGNGFELSTDGSFTGTLSGGSFQGSLNCTNSSYTTNVTANSTGIVGSNGVSIRMEVSGSSSSLSGGGSKKHSITFTTDSAVLSGNWVGTSSSPIASDRNVKYDIAELSDAYDALFDNLKPSVYKYDDGTSGRIHTGFIAQDVLEAMGSAGLTTSDFAGYVEATVIDSETEQEKQLCCLRYEEFIALAVHKIQKLTPRISATEKEILSLKQEISELRAEIQNLKNS